jgi:EAL and modified HD-GYP domain-containing signal transduction protein
MMSAHPTATNPSAASARIRDAAAATEEIFLARQPILDRAGRLVAHELLFRGSACEHANIQGDFLASSTVVYNTLAGMGIEAVLGASVGYVNVDHEFLLSDLVELLPPEHMVLEVLESVVPTDEVIARMEALRAIGYQFALDDCIDLVPDVERFLDHVDVVKIDLLRVCPGDLGGLVARLRRHPVRLLAEKVETPQQLSLARSLGFELFQGYHFARPELLTGRQQRNPGKLLLLRLLSLILADAEISALEMEFKRQPALAYNLLRMVNSASMGLRTQIDSLRHALVLLGRRALRNWMQLTLYTAGSKSNGASPLLQMAAVRGKLIESLMRLDPNARQQDTDAAFLTGILSLLEALLEMPLKDVLLEVYVADEVKAALLERRGRLGQLLHLTELLEADDPPALRRALEQVPAVTPELLLQLQLEAFAWAGAVESDLSA